MTAERGAPATPESGGFTLADALRRVLDSTSDLVAITDADGRLLYLNDALRAVCGLGVDDPGTDDLATFDLATVIPAWAQRRHATETEPALASKGSWSGELAYVKEGHEIPVSVLFIAHRGSDDEVEFISSIARDMSERKALEERLAHEATHDPLTGLPNRALLLDRLSVVMWRAQRSSGLVAVVFLDLDHFKVVNDSLGHSAGDRLLAAVAQRLSAAVRPGDTVARFGGDEFVVVCEDLATPADGEVIARRLGVALQSPVDVGGAEIHVTASAGLAFGSGRDDPEALVRDADAAMYRAKQRGRGRTEVFDEDLRAQALDRLAIEGGLRRALERHELRLLYQPTIDLRTGAIVGVEALLRWSHPERGLLAPRDFLDVAEETGLIVPIGQWVADQACRQLARWRVTIPGSDDLFLCLNISARQLGHPGLIEDLAAVLVDTGTDAASIDLEVTESAAMDDATRSTATFIRLKEVGFRLAIDDFGTGYSSLAHLRRFPVDLLKVDRAFVSAIDGERADTAVVAAVISLAHTLDLRVIAEGVETQAQLDQLRALDCDLAEGHLFAPPMTGDECSEMLVAAPTW